MGVEYGWWKDEDFEESALENKTKQNQERTMVEKWSNWGYGQGRNKQTRNMNTYIVEQPPVFGTARKAVAAAQQAETQDNSTSCEH